MPLDQIEMRFTMREDVRVTARDLVKHSKRLSFLLRHRPESVGLRLEAGGWLPVEALLTALRDAGHPLTREELRIVVATNDKRRFAFDEEGIRIRATQGHSIEIELGLSPVVPPPLLWHGTVAARLEAIRSEGLRRMNRHHVHLSAEVFTAQAVGARRGSPIVLEVAAAHMHTVGHLFYLTDNGVWLTAAVPIAFIAMREENYG